MAYGRDGYAEIVERNCTLAEKLGSWIIQSENFELLAPVKLNIVCFTLKQADSNQLKEFLGLVRDDGHAFFTPTVFKGRPAIRAAISNWQTTEEDINMTIQALKNTVLASQWV